MISLRSHILSLAAVLLALAAGVALGGGPLQAAEPVQGGPADDAALAAARSRAATLGHELAYSDAYARATADKLVAGTLDGRAVTLVTLPGADAATVRTLTDLVGRAGGTVVSRYALDATLLDPGNRQLVTELAGQMQRSPRMQPGGTRSAEPPAGAGGYDVLGRLLGHALLTDARSGAPVDRSGAAILAAVSTADLVSFSGDPARRGSVALVVAGAPYGSADQRKGAGSIVGSLLGALDAAGDGVVLAGPAAAAAEDGLVAALRADPVTARRVSTVDRADRAPGAVAVVLALAEQARGGSGRYGAGPAAESPVP